MTSCPAAESSIVKQAVGKVITFTCKHNSANNAPVSYKFYKGTDEITTGPSNGVWAMTVAADDNDKMIKCVHFNKEAAKINSAEIKVSVSK